MRGEPVLEAVLGILVGASVIGAIWAWRTVVNCGHHVCSQRWKDPTLGQSTLLTSFFIQAVSALLALQIYTPIRAVGVAVFSVTVFAVGVVIPRVLG